MRLYAPNMRCVDLAAPGYYFLATDTPGVMRWLATQAEREGACIAYSSPFRDARRTQSGFFVEGVGATRYLVGADADLATRQVAQPRAEPRAPPWRRVRVRRQQQPHPDKLHCFIDRKVAPGYIGWMVAGVGVVQVGLGLRAGDKQPTASSAMTTFLEKIAPITDFRGLEPASVRAGTIPCGGVVRPVAASRVLLVGDAAGMVSPVTAGGIHTALKHGLAAGHAIADFLDGRSEDPSSWFVRSYPRFRTKRRLRFLYDHFQSDLLFDLFLGTSPMRMAAGAVYFHHKGVFDPKPRTHTRRSPLRGRDASLPEDRPH